MSSQQERPRNDLEAAVDRIRAWEQRHRSRRLIAAGVLLAPLSCWLAITRYQPDYEWSAPEVALAAPLLLLSAAAIARGAWLYPRAGRQAKR